MANTQSAKKQIRKSEKKRLVNKSRKSRIKTFIKKVISAIQDQNKDLAMSMLKLTQSEIMKGVSRGVVKLNKASRKISQLSKKIKNNCL